MSYYPECISFWRAHLVSLELLESIRPEWPITFLQKFYLKGAVVYIDDSVIYGTNMGAFLDLVLERMARFNVRLKLRKYIWNGFCRGFGHWLFSMQTVFLSIQEIQYLPERNFIVGLSTYIMPPTILTKKRHTSEDFHLMGAARNEFYLVKVFFWLIQRI